MVFGLCGVWPGVQLCNLDMMFSACTKISYKAPWGCGVCRSRGLPGCQGPPRFIVSCFFCSSLSWLVQGRCFRSEWLLECRVFLSVPTSWCWRLNGALWVGDKEAGSQSAVQKRQGLFVCFSKDLDSAAWGAGMDCSWVAGHAKSFRLLK